MPINCIVRPAKNIEEAITAQNLDNEVWKNGYQYYEKLYTTGLENKDPDLLLVGVEENTEKFLGYIGVERFAEEDLIVGAASNFTKNMPPWNHDTIYKLDGTIWHIAGHSVTREARKEGVSAKIIQGLINRARERNDVKLIATTYNLNHPTLKDPEKFWGGYGFEKLSETYDPNWNHDGELHLKDIPNDGSIVYALKIS